MNTASPGLHNIGFALALGLLALMGWQAVRTQDALLDANASVADSLELITVVQATMSSLQDVETGMRGFVITANDEFLDPYHQGRARLVQQRALLARLLAGRPGATDWLADAGDAIDRRVETAAANVAARRAGGVQLAVERVQSAGGKEAMDRARALLSTLEAAERERLAARQATVARQVDRMRLLAALGAMAVLALLGGAVVSVNRSLQQRLRLAARSQAGEARQTALLQALPDALWQRDVDGDLRLLSAGEAHHRVPPELLAAVPGQLPPPGAEGAMRSFEWSGGALERFEVRVVSAGAGHLVVVRDISEAERGRRALADQREFLRTIVDTDENVIFVRDASGRFALCNVAFAALLGVPPGQLEGRAPAALAGHAGIRPLLSGDEAMARADGEGEWRARQIAIVDAAGEERWMQVLKRPLALSDGKREVLTVAVDITARLRAERMKNEFISTVSHELRTPLTSIRGALGMIVGGMAGDVPEGARPLLDIAHKNTERLVRLINDILDMEKLDSGALQLALRPAPLRELVAQSVEHNAGYAQAFEVTVAMRPGDDGVAAVDPDRLAQVMANLLSNAIKHSDPGGTVEVWLARVPGALEISVADHGPGIPEAFRPRLFERFAQADSSDARTRGGTGLGLAITRSLVEQMGGEVGFDTALGAGTRFFVRLPEAAPGALAPAAPAAGADRETLVLLSDDAGIAGELMRMLEQEGYATALATDPADARALLHSRPAAGLVIDLSLPEDAGPAFLRELRTQPRYRHLPVLMLGLQPPLASGDVGLRGGAVGVVDWLAKPLDLEQVSAAVRSCLRGGGRERPHVLHVEDDADLRELLRGLLAPQGIELHAAADLAQARLQLEQRRHDLLILDLMLPDGDGASLLPELGAASPPTPVIIFSARDGAVPESRLVLKRLVKSRSDAAELASLIAGQLQHWPRTPSPHEDPE